MTRATLLLAAGLFATRASAMPLAVFQESATPGSVTGSASGAAIAHCNGADVAADASLPGAAQLAPSPTALGAADPADMVLRLSTTPPSGPDTLAQTRWQLVFNASEPSLLNLRMAFVTSDPAQGDWWQLALDGDPFACGDVKSMQAQASGVLAPGDASTAWSDLGGGLPVGTGVHVLTAVVGDGTDSTGDSSLLIDDVVLLASQPPPTQCRPAPPEDVGEIAYQPGVNPRRWTFDDNRFCSSGPQLGCSRCLSGETPPCGPNDPLVDPNDSFVDSTNRSFEMYVVADCGREMHIPLNDVESGCISVFDSSRFPVAIHVTNNAGFSEDGGEVCWNATNCDGGGGNDPGGPGNERVIDVSFTGDPALCGVYILNFRSWAGCIWDLFANCDGTGTQGFRIYDDECEAAAAVNLLPEIVIDDMQLSPSTTCAVDYCVMVSNIGCQVASDFVLRVQNETDFDEWTMTLGPGFQRNQCGRLDIVETAPVMFSTVTAIADFGNRIVECTEDPTASSCDPAFGADQRSGTQRVECNQVPTCDAGGPYSTSCTSPGPQSIQLDGTGSSDPEGLPLSYSWTTTCPGVIDAPTSPRPHLIVPDVACTQCTVTLTVTDSAGSSSTCSSNVSLGDTIPPVLTCPADSTLECAGPGAHAAAHQAWLDSVSATDNCSGSRPVTRVLLSSSVPCPGALVETWEFSATDACNNRSACTRTWTETDTQPPVVAPPPDRTVECTTPASDRQAWLLSATATDACDGPLPVTSQVVDEQRPCPQRVVTRYRFTATDACGHVGEAFATYESRDTQPPTLNGVPPSQTAPCDAVPAPAQVTASDACDPNPSVTMTETSTPGRCPQERTIVRTWTATDACGNQSVRSQTITVVDTQAPTLNGVPPSQTAQCNAVPGPPQVTASDACDPNPSVTMTETSTPGRCPQERTIVRTWTATDACGNAASRSQTITVVDTQAPTLSGVPANQSAPCDAVPGPPQVTASDGCDPNPSVTMTETSAPGRCPQERTIVRTWTATDACGNAASRSQTITVVDTQAPTLSGVPANQTAPCDAVPGPPQVTASDACDPNPSVTMTETSTPGRCPQERTIVRTWTATDACGNAASRSQTITVVDTEAPVLQGVPPDTTASCASIPPPPPVTARDNCDPSPAVTFNEARSFAALASTNAQPLRRVPVRGLVRSVPDAHCPDHYTITRTWTARDACGNQVSRSQRIDVSDTQAPTLQGVPPDATVPCPNPPPPAQVTASDDCDPNPVVTMTEARQAGRCPNEYTLTREWTGRDRCGNETQARQVVSVVDRDPPTIAPPSDITVECPAPSSGPSSEAGWRSSATAADACGPATPNSREISRTPACGNTYAAVFEFWAVDACANESARVRRTYRVVDTTPPVLTAPADKTVECPAPGSGPDSESAWLASASATDSCAGASVRNREVSRTPGCGRTYTAVFELWAVDDCANESARVRRTYRVVDTTPPVLSAPADKTVECPAPGSGPDSEAAWAASATATDTCGSATASSREVSREDLCGETYVATWEFWATDECGNESARELRRYRVVDTTPPVFSRTGDQFVESIWPSNHGYVVYQTAEMVSATDACGAVVVRATGCRSSQPEEVHQGSTPDGGNGDGHFGEDCVLSVDGTQFAVRAERLGSCGANSMRVYEIGFTAVDECGNAAPGTGRIVVEHDRSGHQDVRRGRKLGPNDPPPFPYVHPTIYGTGCGP